MVKRSAPYVLGASCFAALALESYAGAFVLGVLAFGAAIVVEQDREPTEPAPKPKRRWL